MKPKVSICCLTYNHAPYIRKCIDSFLKQRCNFEFEILIHDDASNDGTVEIIEEYKSNFPDIIKPIIQKENQYSRGYSGFNAKYNYPRCKGEYIAVCDGDDYWTDEYKLQKQVNLLERYQHLSLVSTGYIDSEGREHIFNNSNSWYFEFNIDDWIRTWYTKTLTVLFRRECITEYLEVMHNYRFGRDVHLFYHLLKKGNGMYLKESTGVYNIHEGGVASMIDEKTSAMNSYRCWNEIYHFNKDVISKKMLFYSILKLLRTGHEMKCKYLIKCLALSPNIFGYWRVFYNYFRGAKLFSNKDLNIKI